MLQYQICIFKRPVSKPNVLNVADLEHLPSVQTIFLPHRRHCAFSRPEAHTSLTNLSFDWLSLTVDDGVRGNDAVRAGVGLHHLELHCSHAAPHQEDVIWQHK